MVYNPDVHRRRSIRLKGFDYRQGRAYFLTLCSFQREALFGEVVEEEVRLNVVGATIDAIWQTLPQSFTHVQLDAYVIMPNHLHAILHITAPVGAKQGPPASPGVECLVRGSLADRSKAGEADGAFASPLQETVAVGPAGTMAGSLGAVVQNFKSVSTRRINKIRDNVGCPLWQRNYYERVIRNEADLEQIREYIAGNPRDWPQDENHPVPHIVL